MARGDWGHLGCPGKPHMCIILGTVIQTVRLTPQKHLGFLPPSSRMTLIPKITAVFERSKNNTSLCQDSRAAGRAERQTGAWRNQNEG